MSKSTYLLVIFRDIINIEKTGYSISLGWGNVKQMMALTDQSNTPAR